MSLIEYAKTELNLIGLLDNDSDYDGLLGKAVLELLTVFAKQGHSGCSADLVSDLFNKLSRYKTLSPLTGKDDEWNNVGNDMFQNKRNPAVFKNGKEERPYYINADTQKTQTGNCYGGTLRLKDGRIVDKCYIKDFSNLPTITIDVIENEIIKDNWEMYIKDESQLDELAKYYDFKILEGDNCL